MDLYLWAQPQEEGHSKEVPSTTRNEEEIARFTVDERLGDVERAVLFLNSGQAIQQKHAITNLPALLRGRGRAAFDTVAQPLKSALNRLDQEAQVSVADSFATVARDGLLSPSDLAVCLLPLVIRNINKEKSEEETEAWLGALHDMLPQLETDVLRSEVVSLALSKGEVQDSVNSRVLCARILGDVAQYLSPPDIDRLFFKKATAMCQDVDFQVRVSMAAQMGAIGRAVGKDMAAKYVLDELFELLNDEQPEVRVAAFSSLISLLDHLSPEARKALVLPVLRHHLKPVEMDLMLQRCIARLFGAMMRAVHADMELEDQQLFLNCYRHFAARNDLELRRVTAQQLHAVLAAATAASASAHTGTSGGTIFSVQFTDTLNNMLADMDEAVRVAVASNFHEIAAIVDKQCMTLLSRALIRLLRDNSLAVQAALLPNLTSTLQCWVVNGEPGIMQESTLNELLRSLLELEGSLQRAWRLQNALAAALPAMVNIFSTEQLLDQLVPMVMRFLSNPVNAVRPTAADGAVALLRAVRKIREGRCDFWLRLVREFARGRSFSQRLTFAEILRSLMKRYSSKWFKDFAFELSLELLYDAVPNVRIGMVSMLPSLKQTIKMPEDVDLLERLNNAIANAMNDNDRDISALARTCNDSYKKIPLRMGGGTSFSSPIGDGSMAVFEANDRRKEEEEAEFPYAPEDLKEIKAEVSQTATKKAGLGRGRGDTKPAGPGTSNLRSSSSAPSSISSKLANPGIGSPPGLHPKPAPSPVTSSSLHSKPSPISPMRGGSAVVSKNGGPLGGPGGHPSKLSLGEKLSPLPKNVVPPQPSLSSNGMMGRGSTAQVKLPSLGRGAGVGFSSSGPSSPVGGAGPRSSGGGVLGKASVGNNKLTPVPTSLLVKRGK